MKHALNPVWMAAVALALSMLWSGAVDLPVCAAAEPAPMAQDGAWSLDDPDACLPAEGCTLLPSLDRRTGEQHGDSNVLVESVPLPPVRGPPRGF